MKSSSLLETCPLKVVDEILKGESFFDISESGPRVRDQVLQLYANTDAIPFRPPCNFHNGKVIKVKAMIQHESLGNHFFLPLGQDKNGGYVNAGLFRDISESSELVLATSPECMVTGRSEHFYLMERSLMIVTSLPEEDTWSGRLLALIYSSFSAKVNDVVELTGIYYENITKAHEAEVEYPYYLPSVHVLSIKHIPQKSEKPLTDWAPSRTITLDAISAVMGIDHKASTMLLMSLLSHVTSRTSGLLSSLLIGYFPLNIRLAEAPSVSATTSAIISFLRRIFPRSCLIQLNLKAFEETLFVSSMNYDTGELERGILQVPNDTLVIIDETALEAGKLSEKATGALQSLIEFVSHQKVVYEFGGYHTVSVDMNSPVIVLSQGKSILPVDNHIVVPAGVESSTLCVDTTLISNYIGSCRDLEIDISVEIADEIHALFMKERRREGDKSVHLTRSNSMDANELGAALNLSRLLAASFGSTEMTLAHFSEAHSLIRNKLCS